MNFTAESAITNICPKLIITSTNAVCMLRSNIDVYLKSTTVCCMPTASWSVIHLLPDKHAYIGVL